MFFFSYLYSAFVSTEFVFCCFQTAVTQMSSDSSFLILLKRLYMKCPVDTASILVVAWTGWERKVGREDDC